MVAVALCTMESLCSSSRSCAIVFRAIEKLVVGRKAIILAIDADISCTKCNRSADSHSRVAILLHKLQWEVRTCCNVSELELWCAFIPLN